MFGSSMFQAVRVTSLPLLSPILLVLWACVALFPEESRAATMKAVPAAGASVQEDVLARADLAYARRGLVMKPSGKASPEKIGEAIELYQAALEASPEDLSIRWRLLRALYFAGDFSAETLDERREYLDRGVEVAAEGMEQVANRYCEGEALEDFKREKIEQLIPQQSALDVGALYFWTALLWGSWAQAAGTFDAVREGVANRLFEYSGVVLALSPSYYTGGIHRLLSHMHATLPKVPFFSGWVDRDEAIPEARAALAIAPDERGNHVVYAMAVLATGGDSRQEAIEKLAEVAALEPRKENRAEDIAVRQLARDCLAEEQAEDADPDSAVGQSSG